MGGARERLPLLKQDQGQRQCLVEHMREIDSGGIANFL